MRLRPVARVGVWTALSIAAVGLAGCSTTDSSAPAPTSSAPAQRLALADCDEATPTGKVDRSAYGLRYAAGTMRVAVRPTGGQAQCVEFAKSGNPAVEVPPDTLLFTFSGSGGEGGQFEFLSMALTGGRLPGGAHVGPLTQPIPAKVGVSISGTYYASPSCSLALSLVNDQEAAGTFRCPQAVAQQANPFKPSDDVSYEEPTAAPPAQTASISGRFEVRR